MNHTKKTKSHKNVHPVAAPAAPTPATSADAPAQAAAPAVSPQNPVTPPGDMPPAAGAPATPKGWKAAPAKGRGKTKGQRLTGAQVANQGAAGTELTTSTTYTSDFGSRAPSQGVLGFLLTNAASWRALWAGATQFLDYCAEQRQKWEDAAATEMAAFQPSFEFVASRDPAIAEKYAATAKYLGAKSARAKRAATTRKTNDRAKAKTAEAAAPATATAPSVNAAGGGKTVN